MLKMVGASLWLLLSMGTAWAKLPLSKDEKAWLRMVDVIITPEERKIFKKRLQSTRERKAFMELFWAKRDPDLEDLVNPFKEEYLARFDYVLANYEARGATVPLNDRSVIYLILGKPTRTEYRIDLTIMGPRFRNTFFQHRPELWVYEDLGFDYRRKRLKIQFIPTTSFGDYVALTDNFTSIWLKKFKYKLIYHPELETAPLPVAAGEYFQDVVDARPAGSEPEILEDEKGFDAEIRSEKSSSKPVIPTTSLTVPSTTAEVGENRVPSNFDPSTGNALGLTGRLSYFRSDKDASLLLGRIGFPLNSLDFQFGHDQFEAPFILDYRLVNSRDESVFADSIRSQVLLPDRKIVEKEGAVFAKEFALILPSDRYRLKVQLRDVNGEKTSYWEMPYEIPVIGGSGPQATDLVLMDPNINPDEAKFNIEGKPLSLGLTRAYQPGDRLYPVVEILYEPTLDELDTLRFHAVKDNEIWQTWELYPEETSSTNQATLLVHPVLSTKALPTGPYRLRFEMETQSGFILASETEFNLQSR